ncbi:hypothetical protein [Streptococcus devriesei]|nr:hypothetical protein [Streptococcus devriesei]
MTGSSLDESLVNSLRHKDLEIKVWQMLDKKRMVPRVNAPM